MGGARARSGRAHAGAGRMGNRQSTVPGSRARPLAARGAPRPAPPRARSGTTVVVLDPILSLRQRIRLVPGASVRLSFITGVAADRETAQALAQKYRDPNAASRAFALAFIHAQSGLHHLGISSEDGLLFER